MTITDTGQTTYTSPAVTVRSTEMLDDAAYGGAPAASGAAVASARC